MSASGNEILTMNQFLSDFSEKTITSFPNKIPSIGQIMNIKNGLYDYKLPEQYIRLEYIESTENGPYINTGFNPNQNTRVVMDLYSSNNIGECHVFGSRTAIGSTSYDLIIDSESRWRNDYNLSQKTLGSSYRSGTIHIDMNMNMINLNEYTASHQQQSFSVPYPIYLLALNTGGSTTTFCKAKLRKCDIYDNGQLARRFIPCKNTNNGAIGLYDLANDVFYENAGSGSFKAGPAYRSRIPVSKLPEGYTQVEYIQSDGTGQYIDSEFVPDPVNSAIVMDAELYTDCTDKHFFGCRHTTTSKAFALMITSSSKWRSDYNDSRIQFSTVPENGRLGLVINSSNAKVGNEIVARDMVNFTLDYSAYIFAVNTGGSASTFAPIRVYSVQMYKNGLIEKNFIPCVQNSNNEVGLYDLVNNKFYGNSGSGNFTSGPSVSIKSYPITLKQYKIYSKPKLYTVLEYIEYSGEQVIDTGFKPNNNTRVYLKIESLKSDQDYTAIFGGRTSSTSASFSFWIVDDSFFRFDYGTQKKEIRTNALGNFVIDINKNSVSINGNTSTTSSQTFQSKNSIRIGSNVSNSEKRNFVGKMYYFKIYDNGNLVRDYIPVKMKDSGEIGFYDKVNEIFYKNVGTGAFIGGPEIGYI